jgi:hypothetical protein
VNAAELLEHLGRPRVRGAEGLGAVVTGLPVEVALTTQATDAAMRRSWRDRQKGRATPLLGGHDAPGKPGIVRVLGPGPTEERVVVREVPAE